MSAIITNKFRKNSRELFINDIGNPATEDYFVGIGKSEPWPDVGGDPESALNYSVPLPDNTLVESSDVLRNLISLLKVESTFTTIPRNEWVSGRVYKVYDPTDTNIFNLESIGPISHYPCYISHADKIYVCLRNNEFSSTGSITNIALDDFENSPSLLDDGYMWAYVCDLAVNSDFFTDQFVDIPTDISNQIAIGEAKTATGGMVYGFKIIDGGTLTGQANFNDITLIGKGIDAVSGEIIALSDFAIRTSGVDAAGFAVNIDTNSNTITSILITSEGGLQTGYLEASVLVNDVETNIIPMVAPIDGFGFSPRSDLPSFYAGLSVKFVGNAGGEAPIGVGYRQVSLVKGATRTDNDGENASPNIYDTLKYLEVSSSSAIPIAAGTIITHTSNFAKAYLDYVDGNRVYYHQNSSSEINQKPFETDGSASVTFTAPGEQPTSNYSITSLGQGEYNEGSGEVIFLENRKAILRNNNQQEDIKLVIQF